MRERHHILSGSAGKKLVDEYAEVIEDEIDAADKSRDKPDDFQKHVRDAAMFLIDLEIMAGAFDEESRKGDIFLRGWTGGGKLLVDNSQIRSAGSVKWDHAQDAIERLKKLAKKKLNIDFQ